MAPKVAPTRDEYDAAFLAECARSYPVVDDLERELGYAIDKGWLENAARVLACPIKVNPPNWQHGRVIYAVLRDLAARRSKVLSCVDIGTAKGFSALCMLRALKDAEASWLVTSVDVVDPAARVLRNTVMEIDGPRTLRETLEPWPESIVIELVQGTGSSYLKSRRDTVDFAFVDGKHNFAAVAAEILELDRLQQPGAVILFDDVQIPGVAEATKLLEDLSYESRRLVISPARSYLLSRRF